MKPSYLGVIELKRTRELNKPVKIVQLTQFENEADAYKYLVKFPDNQIIAPTVKAAMHSMEKWKMQGDIVKVYTEFSRVNDDQIVLHSDWISQVFLCVFSEDLRISRVFDKDTILAACQKLRNKEKARKRLERLYFLRFYASNCTLQKTAATKQTSSALSKTETVQMRWLSFPEEWKISCQGLSKTVLL